MFDCQPFTKVPPAVLVVLHQEHSTAGRIGHLLERRGFRLDVRRPRFGDDLPKTMDEHAAAIIFGGPMSANDSDEYVRREIDWIETPMRESKPFLGVCLGAQMLARRLGERVYAHPQGCAEIGYYPLTATEEGKRICPAPFPDHVYQWHREGFDLPRGAALLATGEVFPNQAFRYGDCAFGLQFHPEVTYAMICKWSTKAAEKMQAPRAQPPEDHRAGWYRHDSAIDRWIDAFIDSWLNSGRSKAASSRELVAA